MKIKDAYNYLFYTFYKFWELVSIPKFWSDAKAIFSIIVLEMFALSSLAVYYRLYVDRQSHLGEGIYEILTMVFLLFVPNYILFLHNDDWKVIVDKYDRIPKSENRFRKIMVLIFCSIVIANFILAFYLFFK